jgi:hypothetical protein
MDSPYRGAKILAGASAGELIFYDPKKKLDKAQYPSCTTQPLDKTKWQDVTKRLMHLEEIYGLGWVKQNDHLSVRIDGDMQTVTPEDFLWLLPKGELEGYH